MSNTTTIYTICQPGGSSVVAVQEDNRDRIAITGTVNKAMFFNISTADRLKELMTRAINNRTRERNYFKLYCDMLDGSITEEEFDKEIEENEDRYVIKQNQDASVEDMEVALEVSPFLMDVKSPDDMAEVFSFSEKSMQKCIQ
jgi:hypothetical protein|uniref:Uncharacterized protein n=1 Tax=Siphoviridae sp. ctNDP2 TaxID=2826265 RepID=A0A8S5NFN8_9CAUD|nr:MAG TPA: hypothetical protein [Siphoviridae sp. ctNDP2]